MKCANLDTSAAFASSRSHAHQGLRHADRVPFVAPPLGGYEQPQPLMTNARLHPIEPASRYSVSRICRLTPVLRFVRQLVASVIVQHLLVPCGLKMREMR